MTIASKLRRLKRWLTPLHLRAHRHVRVVTGMNRYGIAIEKHCAACGAYWCASLDPDSLRASWSEGRAPTE